MDSTRIILSALWIAAMLTALLGDVLRVFAGDFTPGKIDGEVAAAWTWVVAALAMLVPIVMLVLSLVVGVPTIRWVSIVVAGLFIVFNLVGLPYDGAYDNLLIGVIVVFCGFVIWTAWQWEV